MDRDASPSLARRRYFSDSRRRGFKAAGTTATVHAQSRELAGIDTSQVLQKLESSASGLSESRVRTRLKKWGPNAVAHEAGKNVVTQLWHRLRNPLNLLLLTLVTLALRAMVHTTASVLPA